MKRIHALDHPTPGLVGYRAHSSVVNWDNFRDHNGGQSYRELRDALVRCQHGLCGYCEIDLMENDCQIEHVIPQSSDSGQTLSHRNMIACCRGGTALNQFGPPVLEQHRDEERSLPPGNVSCGQAKDDRRGTLDPRTLPAQPSLFRVRSNGEIDANDPACVAAGVPVDTVRATIKMLGLNVRRLRQAREKHWRFLADAIGENLRAPGNVPPERKLRRMARQRLLPNGNDSLPRFFTTERSVFSPNGEIILAEPPQAWI